MSQCTPSKTRVVATPTAMPAAPEARSARARRDRPRLMSNAAAAKVAAAVAAWPEGNEEPENPVNRSMLGRERSTSTFVTFVTMTCPTTTRLMKPKMAAVRVRAYSSVATITATAIMTGVPPSKLTLRRNCVDPLVALVPPHRAALRS